MPASILRLSAVADTLVPPMSRVVTCNSPVTIALPFSNLINPVSLTCPIVSPVISMLDDLILLPVIVLVVVIALAVLIAPNPVAIEPFTKAPTVAILALPSAAA